MRNDFKEMLETCRRIGLRVIIGGQAHGKIILPDNRVIGFSLSASDKNAHRQVIRDLRRYGIDISVFKY